jgi:hypothetical protein
VTSPGSEHYSSDGFVEDVAVDGSAGQDAAPVVEDMGAMEAALQRVENAAAELEAAQHAAALRIQGQSRRLQASRRVSMSRRW